MLDPLVTLSFAIHTNPGLYALLLGSGISRPAGIPTGWEIVLDLIRKLAAIEKENCDPNPEVWFQEKYGKEPKYSTLLEQVAKTSNERQRLLINYFEPTEEDIKQGLRVPTEAHISIAKLVSKGYINLIVTTNFDRLLEKAFEKFNVNPIVIHTADAADGRGVGHPHRRHRGAARFHACDQGGRLAGCQRGARGGTP